MRYLILQPPKPFDPRDHKFTSITELYALTPRQIECKTEKEAATHARRMYPDSVAMPVPVEIGSGTTVLLGFIDDPTARRVVDPDAEIPFVLLIQVVSDTDHDRSILKKARNVFDRSLWKVPVVCPSIHKTHAVEIRATDAEVPVFTTAKVGTHNGRLCIYAEAAGIELALVFDDPQLKLMTVTPEPVTSTTNAPVSVSLDDFSDALDIFRR